MKRRRRAFAAFTGGAVFLVTIAAVVTLTLFAYAFLSERNLSKGGMAAAMFAVVLFLSLVCTAIDAVRRKVMVEKPVGKILKATDAIAGGDFSVRLEVSHPYGRYDEFDCIMENLNRMAAELSKTELLHSDFVSNVSHELKTPLAVIRNYASALKGESDGEKREKYAQALIDASGRLTALVVNVLKLSKLENRELPPEKSVVRLDGMLEEAVLAFETEIEKKGLDVECDLEDTEILSAPDYLEIVWNNLLSNAVKFTEPGGKISVSLKKSGERAIVRVADTGCGISPDTGEHIFEKFYQGDTSHAGEGNGLGLALVKRVIDVLGGEISVESEVGKGSAFTVTLYGVKAE